MVLKGLEPENFPYTLPEGYGKIVAAKEEVPGVYYVSAEEHKEHPRIVREYLVVKEDAPCIPGEAKRYGHPAGTEPALLTYDMGVPESGHFIIRYEMEKYRKAHDLECEEELYTMATYAMEIHPEYFGRIPVPLCTPWGRMTRYREMEPGVFWIETEMVRECVAVFYPIWDSECPEEKREEAVSEQNTPIREGEPGSEYAFYEIRRQSVKNEGQEDDVPRPVREKPAADCIQESDKV